MVTAPLLTVGVQVDLPKVQNEPITTQVEPLVVTVQKDGNIALMYQSQTATGATSGGTGQPRTLGTMSQGQYNTQSQQLNQNADAAAAADTAGKTGTPGTSGDNADQNNEQANAGTAPYALQGTTPDEQYQFAFDLMRQTKYADAERALSTFVDEYPDHPLAGNASYWLGETYYVRKDYSNAAQTFAETFKKFPQSGKAPDSLLKLGMIDEAEGTARRILTEHLDDLHTVANALLEYETLSGEEVKALLRGEAIRVGGGETPPPRARSSVPTSGTPVRDDPSKGRPPGGLEPEPQPGG